MTDVEFYGTALIMAKNLTNLNSYLDSFKTSEFLKDYVDADFLVISAQSIAASNRTTVEIEKDKKGKGHLTFLDLNEIHQNLCRNYKCLTLSAEVMMDFIIRATNISRLNLETLLSNQMTPWGRMRNLFSAAKEYNITVNETDQLQPIYIQLLVSLLGELIIITLAPRAINTFKLYYGERYFYSDVGFGENFILEAKKPDTLSRYNGYAEKLQCLSQLLALHQSTGNHADTLLCAALDDFTSTMSMFLDNNVLYHMPRVHKLRDYLIVTIFRLVAVIPGNLNAFRKLIELEGVLPDQFIKGDELLQGSYIPPFSTLGKHPRSSGDKEDVKGRRNYSDDGVDELYDDVYESDDDYQIRVRQLMVWDTKRRGEVYLDEDVLHGQEDRSCNKHTMFI